MLTAEENEQLTRVGPGTPMGELLRRYWHPIGASAQLMEPGTRAVTLLGERLVLYRDQRGGLGLLESHCAHRNAGLLYGVPEETGLRCSYHGWLYNDRGQCIEQPYEQTEDPASTFHQRIRITSYPVEELGGLIFAYLGPPPTPLVPRWDVLVREDVAKDISGALIPCNWLQVMENSVDPQHAEWLHSHLDGYVLGRLGREQLAYRHLIHREIGFDRFEHGIIERRLRGEFTKEHDMWRVGHPLLFPCAGKTGMAAQATLRFRVPVDDTHTCELVYHVYREIPPQFPIPPYFEIPVPPLAAENGEPPYEHLAATFSQDVLMWFSQGEVTDRTREHLGRSDKGVVLYRQLLEENLRAVQRGEDPMNVFRDQARNQCIELPIEEDKGVRGPWRPGGRASTSEIRSPVIRAYLESQATSLSAEAQGG